MMPEGTRIGKVTVGPVASKGKYGRIRECACDCGREFTRREFDLARANRNKLEATCGQAECRRAASVNSLWKEQRVENKQRHVKTTPNRVKQDLCKVCCNLPWQRLTSSWNDGPFGGQVPVVGPDLKCRGCGGKYAPEPANDAIVLGSSGALWEDVG